MEDILQHPTTQLKKGGIEAALEYMNKMSDENATEKETETVVATTSSDNGERTSSKFMEFISNLGVGIATIIKWILIIIVIVAVIGVIAWFVIKKKDETGESSNLMRSNLSSINNSDEISTAIVDKKQEIEKRKREIEELKNLERESQELDDEYDNIQANSERRRRRDYDDYDTRADYDSRRSSKDLEDILEKMSNTKESKGKDVLVTGLDPNFVHVNFAKKFWLSLKKNDLDTAMQEMKAFLAGVPYVEGFKEKLKDVKNYEGFYEYTFWLNFNMLNVYARTQVKCAGGRIDFVVEMPDTTYVFELKVNGTAQEALDQINSRDARPCVSTYALPYETEGHNVVKVGVAFERETMTVGTWEVE